MTDDRGVGGAGQPRPGPPRTRSKRHSAVLVAAVALGVVAALAVGSLLAGPRTTANADRPGTASQETRRLLELERSQRIAEHASPDAVLMPVVVGLTYQQAARLWRSLGLVPTTPVDVTGADRVPQVPKHWIVLRQYPAAGVVVHRGDDVTATVAKSDDYRWGRPDPSNPGRS